MPSITTPKIESDDDDDADDIKEIHVFNEGEIESIINTSSDYHFLWLLALSTGLRLGELLAFKIDDLKGANLTVNKQVNSIYKIVSENERVYEVVMKKPKSSSSSFARSYRLFSSSLLAAHIRCIRPFVLFLLISSPSETAHC